MICCLKTRISASSATSRPAAKISLHKSNIEQQHDPILDQPPAGLSLLQDNTHRAIVGLVKALLELSAGQRVISTAT
jgi:hypothetical protein